MQEKVLDTGKRPSFQVIVLMLIIVFTQSINGFYAIYNLAPPTAFSLLGYLGIFWLIGDWFTKDSKKRNIEWAFDMGFFLYIFWPIFMPFYLFKTRGFKKAITISISFVAVYLGVYYLSYYVFYYIMP